MLDSERTFKIKVRLSQTLFLFVFKEFYMATSLSDIFKTTRVTDLTKIILESSYRVLQVTFKQKTLKQPIYLLKAVEFCSTFDIQIEIALAIFWEKLQNHAFQKTQRNLSKHASIHINRATYYEKQLFRNMKNLSFFWRLLFF